MPSLVKYYLLDTCIDQVGIALEFLRKQGSQKIGDFMGGNLRNVRLPTQVLLQREYVFFKSDNDVRSLNPEQLDRNVAPSQGSFTTK